MLEFERKLGKQRKDLFHKYFGSTSKWLITYESSAMSMKKEALPISTVSKVRNDSDVSKGLATKVDQHNILSESITCKKQVLLQKSMESARK